MSNGSTGLGCLAFFVGVSMIGGCFTLPNWTNHKVEAGQAQYIVTNPWMGKKEYVDTQIGPNGTGLRWRLSSYKIPITPRRISEIFDDKNGKILGRDKLPIACQGSIVIRIDPNRVRDFMENYGGIAQCKASDDDGVANEILTYAYNNFIEQPFRTAIRTEISKYDSLEASSNLDTISNNVLTEIRKRLEGTPFIVDSVSIGETNPPKSVVEAIELRVRTEQDNQRKAIEHEIAIKNIEIERANGEAEGAKRLEIARGEAEAKIAQGKAESDVVRMRGEADAAARLAQMQAEAEGTRLLSESLNGNVLTLRVAEQMYHGAKFFMPTGSEKGSNPFNIMGLMSIDGSANPAVVPVPTETK